MKNETLREQNSEIKEIEKDLHTKYIGRKIYYFDTISSTNIKAKEIAFEEPDGTVVVAEEQTEGRGRLGKAWFSPKNKGIWMSIILKPKVDLGRVSKLTLVGAVAVNQALEDTGIKSQIKWPNDIVIEDKKVGGILTEMDCELNMINYVVIGIGINVDLEKEDIPEDLKEKATSLKVAENRDIKRTKLLANILNRFEEFYIDFKDDGDISKIIEICKKNSSLIGKEIRIIRGEEIRVGMALDISEEGLLVVELGDGSIEQISSGEVSIRGINKYT